MRRLPAFAVAFLLSASTVGAADVDPKNWAQVLKSAKGETVYFNAWGGEPRINAYIDWAAEAIKERYDVTLEHVKVADTASVVSKVVAEKAAGRDSGGSVDLVWINGENFHALKNAGLLFAPGWADALPNWKYVDVAGKPAITTDFAQAVEGLESPWGMAQLVFIYDLERTPTPPRSLQELAEYVSERPGRFTYPQPPNFYGSTFLKQALHDLIDDPSKLQQPVVENRFAEDTAPLFAFLDALHPNLWRSGRAFPQNAAVMRQLLGDGAIDIAFTHNPADASAAIANGELPNSARTFVFGTGTIGNAHFLAIPYNANAKAGALVTANFLLSPEAQAHKQDPEVWGDPTVLDIKSLKTEDKARFDALDLGVATLTPAQLGISLSEPHSSWMERLEKEWLKRYGVQ